MNEAYKNYLKGCWKEAEDICEQVIGAIDNFTVATIFDKIAKPYYYWEKQR